MTSRYDILGRRRPKPMPPTDFSQMPTDELDLFIAGYEAAVEVGAGQYAGLVLFLAKRERERRAA